jgi:uncharacterized protein YkwD
MKKQFTLVILILVLSISAIFAQKTKTNIVNAKAESTSKIEKEVLEEINYVRKNPREYIKLLTSLKQEMKDKLIRLPNGQKWMLIEGIASIDNAIEDLGKVSGLTPFKPSAGLAEVANNQLSDLKEDISYGHKGKDGSNLLTRLNRVGFVERYFSENISYYAQNAKFIVLVWLIDDNVKSRGHRKALLSTNFNEIGIAFANGKTNNGLCVAVFADKFTK